MSFLRSAFSGLGCCGVDEALDGGKDEAPAFSQRRDCALGWMGRPPVLVADEKLSPSSPRFALPVRPTTGFLCRRCGNQFDISFNLSVALPHPSATRLFHSDMEAAFEEPSTCFGSNCNAWSFITRQPSAAHQCVCGVRSACLLRRHVMFYNADRSLGHRHCGGRRRYSSGHYFSSPKQQPHVAGLPDLRSQRSGTAHE